MSRGRDPVLFISAMTLRLVSLSKKESFGHDRYWPACETSRQLTEITGRKTFNKKDLEIFIKMGFEIEFTERTYETIKRNA